MESEPGKAAKNRPKRGFWSVIQWIFLWGTIFGLTGVALVAVTNKAVIWSSSDSFCGTLCHTMTWSSAAYHQGPHFINASGFAQAAVNATSPTIPATQRRRST
jgi:nitrate/TMAO reductase-like tetraheme cytochrome c subunit